MTGVEALQSVQFVTVKGKRLAVLSAEDWEALIEWMRGSGRYANRTIGVCRIEGGGW